MDPFRGAKSVRNRSVNFSLDETRSLTDLLEKYVFILENKKADGATNRKKEDIWQKVEEEFNALNSSSHRLAKNLRIKYESLKKLTRRKIADYGVEHLSDFEKKIYEYYSNAEALEEIYNANVSDVTNNTADDVEFVCYQSETIDADTGAIISDYASSTLDESSDMETTQNTTINEVFIAPKTEFISNDAMVETQKEAMLENLKSKTLKRKINDVLAPMEEASRSKINKNLDGLSSTRLRLMQLQIALAEKEIEHKRMQHEQKMRQNKEEHDLKLRIMTNEENRKQEEHHQRMTQNRTEQSLKIKLMLKENRRKQEEHAKRLEIM